MTDYLLSTQCSIASNMLAKQGCTGYYVSYIILLVIIICLNKKCRIGARACMSASMPEAWEHAARACRGGVHSLHISALAWLSFDVCLCCAASLLNQENRSCKPSNQNASDKP